MSPLIDEVRDSSHTIKAFLKKQLRTFKKMNSTNEALIYTAEAYETLIDSAKVSDLVKGKTDGG